MTKFEEFIDTVNRTYDSSELELRYGQVIMNTLYQVWPEKYKEISYTEYDCFYEDGWTFATSQTLEKLRNEWTIT
jgi:hypothetical protein